MSLGRSARKENLRFSEPAFRFSVELAGAYAPSGNGLRFVKARWTSPRSTCGVF